MKFRPPLWAWLLTTLAFSLFATLANWQYQRGQEKADIITLREAEAAGQAKVIAAGEALPAHGRRIVLRGRWLSDQQILLDNQTRQGRVGVHVWTPLQLSDGRRLLVDRGWLEASPYRERWPDTGTLPTGSQNIAGFWRDLPQAGIEPDYESCEQQWPQRLNYPGADLLQCLYGANWQNGLLLLDPDQDHGFVREWANLGIPPERHYGYAVQWGALALTAVVLFIVLNVKRKS